MLATELRGRHYAGSVINRPEKCAGERGRERERERESESERKRERERERERELRAAASAPSGCEYGRTAARSNHARKTTANPPFSLSFPIRSATIGAVTLAARYRNGIVH